MANQKDELTLSLIKNVQMVKDAFGNSTDLSIRELQIGKNGEIKAAVLYIEGLVEKADVQNNIIKSLIEQTKEMDLKHKEHNENLVHLICTSVIFSGKASEFIGFETLHTALLSGNTIILFDNYAQGIITQSKGVQDRGVTEPTTQTVIRGPRDSFSETLRTNTSLIRRRIKSSKLWLETRQIGRVTQTDVSIMYIKGIANDEVIAEVRQRLERIDIDAILESGYIEELIQDETFTPFPTIYNSERPDVICAGILEGRIAILIDGTPFVLLVPALFTQFFQSAEDYYQRSDISSLLRMLRLVAFMISLLGPSAYIAVTTFHQEMIPTQLLISLAGSREGVPFPAFVETLIMEVTFEILREAGVRMPRAIGQTMSIVGGLVLGQAAVQAGLVSPAMVIVVSLTAISSFVIPSYNLAISLRMIRFILMAFAASFGLFGILIGVIAMILHLCSLRSFGTPYMSPYAPFNLQDQKDSVLFRLPHWAMFARPRFIGKGNVKRINNKFTQNADYLSKSAPNEGEET